MANPSADEQRVKEVFPEAYCHDTKRGGFDIIDVRDKDWAMSVGYGRTEEQAWHDAASRQAEGAPEEAEGIAAGLKDIAAGRTRSFTEVKASLPPQAQVEELPPLDEEALRFKKLRGTGLSMADHIADVQIEKNCRERQLRMALAQVAALTRERDRHLEQANQQTILAQDLHREKNYWIGKWDSAESRIAELEAKLKETV